MVSTTAAPRANGPVLAPPSQGLTAIGVGIDTARYGHVVSFLRPDRQPAAKKLLVMENHASYQALRERLEQLHQQHPQAQFHVRIDAAGQYANNLDRFLRGLALPLAISTGEPKRNLDYQRAHFPKRQTDETESIAMARFAVVETPPATAIVPEALVLLGEVAGRLQAQIKQATQALNRLHNLLARVFPELALVANDFAAGWVLTLLSKYPSAAKIAQARLASLKSIPYLPKAKAEELQQAARESVGTLRGAVAETLVRELAGEVRHSQDTESKLRQLLIATYQALPEGKHTHIGSIPGIGETTAAILVAKIIDIDRFASPDDLVGFFGIFPEEYSSGVDKKGRPLPPGTLVMSPRGNDLVRGALWMAAMSGLRGNPALRALYRRLRAKGKRGDVALGHCMRKLLHLVFAVWKTGKPFDPKHYPWLPETATPATATAAAETPTVTAAETPAATPTVTAAATPAATPTVTAAATPAATPTVTAAATPAATPTVTAAATPAATPTVTAAATPAATPTVTAAVAPTATTPTVTAAAVPAATTPLAEAPAPASTLNEKAVGHNRDQVPVKQVVTTASSSVEPAPAPVNPPSSNRVATAISARPKIDFAYLRAQVTMAQVLQHLGLLDQFKGTAQQRRGPCPVHAKTPAAGPARPGTCSVHFGKNVFHCFHAKCAAQGNVLDLWAAVHRLPLYEAALHLATTFQLHTNREEAPVKGRANREEAPVKGRKPSAAQTPSPSAVITTNGG